MIVIRFKRLLSVLLGVILIVLGVIFLVYGLKSKEIGELCIHILKIL